MQDFLKSCDRITHYVRVVHAEVFNSDVGCLSYLSMCRPKKPFESNPLLLDCCYSIPISNIQSKLDHPVNNHISDIHGLDLCVKSPGDIGKLEEFFDSVKYGRDRVSSMVGHILDNVFVFKNLVGHQLIAVVLDVIWHVLQGFFD